MSPHRTSLGCSKKSKQPITMSKTPSKITFSSIIKNQSIATNTLPFTYNLTQTYRKEIKVEKYTIFANWTVTFSVALSTFANKGFELHSIVEIISHLWHVLCVKSWWFQKIHLHVVGHSTNFHMSIFYFCLWNVIFWFLRKCGFCITFFFLFIFAKLNWRWMIKTAEIKKKWLQSFIQSSELFATVMEVD